MSLHTQSLFLRLDKNIHFDRSLNQTSHLPLLNQALGFPPECNKQLIAKLLNKQRPYSFLGFVFSTCIVNYMIIYYIYVHITVALPI